MLALTVKDGSHIRLDLGDGRWIHLKCERRHNGSKFRLFFDAPDDVLIFREELWQKLIDTSKQTKPELHQALV